MVMVVPLLGYLTKQLAQLRSYNDDNTAYFFI